MGRGEMFVDFIVYINKISYLVESDVFVGKENWFVMINVFCDKGQDWD